jgi:UDP-N-acetylmuramate dehydrogenase
MQPERDIQLAPLTTFRLGGKVRYFVDAHTDDDVISAVKWAKDAHVSEVFLLGGGSNLVVADTPLSGLVIRCHQKGIELEEHGEKVTLRAAAGETWDDFVRYSVERDCAGLECLSGIPGSVGATPIQNVGAYGQEVAQTISKVTVFDTIRFEQRTFSKEECTFGYRNSRFKHLEPNRYIILNVEFILRRGSPAPVRHAELSAVLQAQNIDALTPQQIRACVLSVRARKSMLLNPEDPFARSAGSFFVNPIVSKEQAAKVRGKRPNLSMPSWDMVDHTVKLAAAWLIENAGFKKGFRVGNVGLSPHHCLVIVAHERAEAIEVITFAQQIRREVFEQFGVMLSAEPRFWGFERYESELPELDGNGPVTLGSAPCPPTTRV